VADVEHRFFSTEQVADDGPVYIPTHRMAQQRPDMRVVLARDFQTISAVISSSRSCCASS
jgi:hypothetical protein